jgi:small subunit ribosomal protein S2
MASPSAEALPVKFKGIEAPRGEADDLKRITGVTPKLEQRLNDAGVFHYWQIADLDADNSKALDLLLKLKGQIEQEDWVGQAKKLVDAAAA